MEIYLEQSFYNCLPPMGWQGVSLVVGTTWLWAATWHNDSSGRVM